MGCDNVLYIDPFDSNDITAKVLLLADPTNYRLYQSKVSELSFVHTYEDIAKEFLNLLYEDN